MKSLLRLKPYIRPHLGLIIGSSLLAIPLAAIKVAPVEFVNQLIPILEARDQHRLAIFTLGLVGLYLLNFVVRFFHYFLLRIAVARINQKLKNDLYEHIMGLSADHFTTQSTGTLISRVGSDTSYIDAGITNIGALVRVPLTFLALLARVLYLNWRLTLLTFLVFPALAWVFSVTARNLKRYIQKLNEENARLFSTLQESFTGVRVVKMFQLEKYTRKKFRERTQNFSRILLKAAMIEEASHPLVELLVAAVIAAMVYYGGTDVVHGKMQTGDLIAFCTALGLMMDPIRSMNEVNIKLNQAASACTRIFEVFDWRSRLHIAASPTRIRSFDRSIEFRDVCFAYPDAPERPILRGVSFEIPKGQVIAIVGASGAGKSSMVSLLPRIFDITGGSIRIDGHDLRDLELDDLRSLIAVVNQDVFLFNDTVGENIRCGRLSARGAEIEEAAKHAHALDFIRSLPEGFQSIVGDRGQKLSGGEKQRISIARAFLRQAPILILDEATSSLDNRSERAVQEALEELMKDRTTLVIAHRLSTIRGAHRILVMKEGLLVESGTHPELLALNGEYSRYHRIAEESDVPTA